METSSNYSEYLVAQKATGKTIVLRVLLLACYAAIIVGSVVMFSTSEALRGFIMAAPVLWFLIGVVVWFLWGFTAIEYEYAIVSGFFQLDTIHSRKSRKRICEAKISEMHFVAPVSEKNAAMRDESKYSKVIKACSSMNNNPNLFCLAYKDAKAGETLVYFDAVAKTLNSFVYYNRNAVDRGTL